MRTAVLALAIAVSLLAGCAGGGHGRDINDPSNSLVFGYVDMADAPTKVSGAQIMQVAPPTDKPYWGTDVRDGMFYTYYLPPGSYKLATLHGSSFLRGDYTYNFGGKGRNSTAVRIQSPGVYFLGAHRYVAHEGKFDMQPAKSPTEKEVLQRLIKQLENDGSLAQYTRQLKLARERLAQL